MVGAASMGKMAVFCTKGALFIIGIAVFGATGRNPQSGVSAREAGRSGRGAVGGGAGGAMLTRRKVLRLKERLAQRQTARLTEPT